jgi:hypothetical protein
MDISQNSFEIEILIFFGWGHTCMPTRREAPVGGFDILKIRNLHQPGYCVQFGIWETIL